MRTVHKVCYMLHSWNTANNPDGEGWCDECPAWEKDKNYGRVQAMCYGRATEFVNIVKVGNPWGVKGRRWPKARTK